MLESPLRQLHAPKPLKTQLQGPLFGTPFPFSQFRPHLLSLGTITFYSHIYEDKYHITS